MRTAPAVIGLLMTVFVHQNVFAQTRDCSTVEYLENNLIPNPYGPQMHILVYQANQGAYLEATTSDNSFYATHPVSTGTAVLGLNDNGEPTDNITPEGKFKVTFMNRFHRSGQFGKVGPDGKVIREEGAKMNYAIFFNGGIALHATIPQNYQYLGTPASHGCVRQTDEDAKLIFEAVCEIGLENVTVEVVGQVDVSQTVTRAAEPTHQIYEGDDGSRFYVDQFGRRVIVRESPRKFRKHVWSIGQGIKNVGDGVVDGFRDVGQGLKGLFRRDEKPKTNGAKPKKKVQFEYNDNYGR